MTQPLFSNNHILLLHQNRDILSTTIPVLSVNYHPESEVSHDAHKYGTWESR